MKSAWFLPRLFVIAVLINYVWEIVQAPLYVGMENLSLVWWHCGLAAVGDGFLVLLIYAVGWVVSRQRDWFVQPTTMGVYVTNAACTIAQGWIRTGCADAGAAAADLSHHRRLA